MLTRISPSVLHWLVTNDTDSNTESQFHKLPRDFNFNNTQIISFLFLDTFSFGLKLHVCGIILESSGRHPAVWKRKHICQLNSSLSTIIELLTIIMWALCYRTGPVLCNQGKFHQHWGHNWQHKISFLPSFWQMSIKSRQIFVPTIKLAKGDTTISWAC